MSITSTALHHKYTHSIEMMLLNAKVNLPYYGEFNLHVNYFSRPNDPSLPTAGVNVTSKGMNHYYNPAFLDGLTQEQVNFLMLHETFHLLLNHPRRTRMGGYDHKLSNIAQDMIINQILVQDIKPDFIDIPKDEFGRNTALFIPKEYEGEWVYEILYDYLRERKEEFEKRKEKKEDNKIFAELFVQKNRPTPVEVSANFAGQHNSFANILEANSKEEYEKYILNFTRKVLTSLNNGMEVKLIGHTSGIVPVGETAPDYNQKLSERRAEMFKNAVLENIDSYMDVYALCLAIIEHEKNTLNEQQKLDYIIKYEEITNATTKKQREVQLKRVTEGQEGNRIEMLFQEYRFTELNKLDEATLKSLVLSKGLQIPNIAQEKAKFVGLGQNLLITEGKGDTERIIENEDDGQPAILRNEVASLPQYATFRNLTDSEKKQAINRRVEYKFDDSQDDNQGGGSSPQSENQGNRDGYGQNGKNGQEGHSMDSIFEGMGKNDGQFMDSHMADDIPEELREQMVKDIQEKLKARGLSSGDIEKTLEKLQKKKKDYLKEIKRGVSFIKGHVKVETITRPNRKGISGLKGKKKLGAKINCIMDTSGSMGGYFEKALSFIFRSDIEINLIMCDTDVKSVDNIKSMKDLKKAVIKGLGGTTMQPAFDLVAEKYNNLNTLLLTDGFTDSLDLAKLKGKVLILSNESECPIRSKPAKGLKQIIIKDFD
jgi:predicted metal-dependent peptidase